MSSTTTLARPYARAAFELALGDDKLPDWDAWLGTVAAVTAEADMVTWLQSPHYDADKAVGIIQEVLGAEVREGLGKITEIDVEFLSANMETKLEDILGRVVTIEIETEQEGTSRFFVGHCVEVFYEGVYEGQAHHVASLRAWPWFMDQTTDCRIFQDMSVPDVVKEIFGLHGYSDYELRLSDSYRTWEYVVQYRETAFNFVSRLMEQEGIYYYFTNEDGKHTMVLADGPSAPLPSMRVMRATSDAGASPASSHARHASSNSSMGMPSASSNVSCVDGFFSVPYSTSAKVPFSCRYSQTSMLLSRSSPASSPACFTKERVHAGSCPFAARCFR